MEVIFFSLRALSPRDFKRFGVTIFQRNGYKVTFFDLSPFLFPEMYKNTKIFPEYENIETHILTQKDAIVRISELPRSSYVVSFAPYSISTYGLFRALSRAGINYSIFLANAIPTVNIESTRLGRLIKKVRNVSLSRLVRYPLNYLFRPEWARYLGVRPPAFLFAAGLESLELGQAALRKPNPEILWAHTLDYDIYLDWKASEKEEVAGKNIAVFLDSPTPRFKRDSLIPGVFNYLTEERYYPSLCKYFDEIEKQLKIEVEIAAHPGSTHEEYPDYFDGRRVIHWKTFDLVARSKLVINRDSTAMNFAVMLGKPVVFVTSCEAEDHPENYLAGSIRAMASWLGKKPINIDDPKEMWCLDDELLIDREAYRRYKESYIKHGGPDINSWQILVEKLKEISK